MLALQHGGLEFHRLSRTDSARARVADDMLTRVGEFLDGGRDFEDAGIVGSTRSGCASRITADHFAAHVG